MWDPDTYLAYEAERTRPARDLLAAVELAAPAEVVDLGCGTGTSTRLLARRWPDAGIEAVDLSPQMIAAAEAESPPDEAARIRYRVGDAAQWEPRRQPDLVFSNALLHWIPQHLALLRRWRDGLGPGGALAVQLPGNQAAPAHTLLRERCARPQWRRRLGELPDQYEHVHGAADYARALAGPGVRVEVWETTYLHQLRGADPVLRWMSGTALRSILAALDSDPSAREEFLAGYADELRAAYPADADGITDYPFRRVFAVAHLG